MKKDEKSFDQDQHSDTENISIFSFEYKVLELNSALHPVSY